MNPSPTGFEDAIRAYRAHLERYRDTLDLISPTGFAQLDRMIDASERYAAMILAHAPGSGTVVDVGSGAGLPGVVVAAALAPRPVWLVERRRKRATFLTGAVAAAGLGQVRVIHDDVRRILPPAGGVEVVTAQAVASLVSIAAWTAHLWGPRVVLIGRKGPQWTAEVAALEVWWRARRVSTVEVGGGADTTRMRVAPRVLALEPLGSHGTLVAVEVLGG
jgi:16S rRNA (guanine527-N7)-methyltransferase